MDVFHAAAPFIVIVLSWMVIVTPVGVFNLLVPKDRGTIRSAKNLSYGPSLRQTLDIYRPEGGGEDLPVIVFCYGGAWFKGHKEAYAFVGRSLAANGVVAVVIDYRQVPKVQFPDFVEDTAAAIRWTAANIVNHGGNPRKLCVLGHSAGAYNAVMAVLGDARLPVVGLVGMSGPYDFLPLRTRVTKRAFGNWLRPDETQPINLVRADAPPMLIMAGAEDRTVKPRDSQALAARLAGAGAPVTLKIYPGMKHASLVLAFAKPFRDRSTVRRDVLDYFAGCAANNPAITGHASS